MFSVCSIWIGRPLGRCKHMSVGLDSAGDSVGVAIAFTTMSELLRFRLLEFRAPQFTN